MSHIPHLMHIDAKSPAKSPSLTRPRPNPEEGFGGLRARAHTLSKPDPPKPGPSPKNPARPDPDITIVDTRFCISNTSSRTKSRVCTPRKRANCSSNVLPNILFHAILCLPTDDGVIGDFLQRPCASEPTPITLEVSRCQRSGRLRPLK